MKRKDFIRSIGAAGLFSGLSGFQPVSASTRNGANCSLIPSETAGPFPLDLTDNSFFLRQDVREDRVGSRLDLQMRIIGADNCEPMPNVRVHIWHCDNIGNYSGYGSEAGLTYLRGYQVTDSNGVVDFTTIFPGWYPGRVCHIHFQVYVNSAYSAVSQLCFDETKVNQIYTDHPLLYPDGADPLTPATDGIFSDGYSLQLASLEDAATAGEYTSFLEVTIEGAGTPTGLQEHLNAQNFSLGQNSPNPFRESTEVPLELYHPSEVALEIWSLNGQHLYTQKIGQLPPGRHSIKLDLNKVAPSATSYLYQVKVENANGSFTALRRMTRL